MFKLITWMLRRYRHLSPGHRLELLRQFGEILVPGYKFAWRDYDWIDDPEFLCYLEETGQTNEFNSHRRWNLKQLLRLTDDVEGHTAECGVYLGHSSMLIRDHNRAAAQSRVHHMFDSFEGLSHPGEHDKDFWTQGDLCAGLEMVKRNVGSAEDLTYHIGWIPESFNGLAEQRYAFVHIDVDLYEPTLGSVEYFYSHMAVGAVILCDDYGFATCPGATKAMDDFFESKPENVVGLASGGGFVIKQ